MRPSRSHGNKRSSTYASTISMVIFVALCVFGVWMLTSDSMVPPQTTTRANTASSVSDFILKGANKRESESQVFKPEDDTKSIVSNREDEKPKSGSKDDQAVYKDNPGRLPDDAIKNDEAGKGKDGALEKQSREESRMSEQGDVLKKGDFIDSALKNNSQSERENRNRNEERQMHNELEEKRGGDSIGERRDEAVVEYEKDQKLQREEDSGNGKASTDDQQKEHKVEEREKEPKTAQEQDLSSVVTFNDSTKEQQNVEQGLFREITQPSNITTNETRQQEHKETKQDINSFQSFANASAEGKSGSNPEEFNLVGMSLHRDKPSFSQESNSETGEKSGTSKEDDVTKKEWKTQASESRNEKKRQENETDYTESIKDNQWILCNISAGADYIPCLDNEKALKKLKTRKHFEHRERHCPEEPPTCLVPLPKGYSEPIKWPHSREKVWYRNVPHADLATFKGNQNWVKISGEFLTFPGGGTQFIHGAIHYIDFLQQAVPNIAWGKRSRVILDIGCGVASFGGYLFDRDVLTMSFAPKDEHEAQVQLALERGIPAISAVMGTQRLPFPAGVFDILHCARCRVPWHNDGGLLLLEMNRVLRPGGYFVWSATPVYQKLPEDVRIWKEMSSLTASMCWELVTINKDKVNHVSAAVFRKPVSNDCYQKRKENNPPMCEDDDDSNAAWYVRLQPCMHKIPVDSAARGSKWPADWPRRLKETPYWLNVSQKGIYGKPLAREFAADYQHWKQVVEKVYTMELGIDWSSIRNAMDMRAVYGGFAAVLRDLKLWVMNIVSINSPDTLTIIYERGLFGIYHDWCESFSTYPRSYDLLHADHLFSKLKERCEIAPVIAEIDRIVRPGGKLIVNDEAEVVKEVENLLKSLHWKVYTTFSESKEGILSGQKGFWRPMKSTASF